ncbi:MAG: cbb3-type cytochrome c oxidase N-terminal domain-containing protein, partial [Bacteroidota bacterium]
EKAGLANTETWFQRQWKKFTPAVPVEKEADIMLDHNYDGIQELDNSLPPWWVAVFYLSIGFAVFYIVYNHFTEFGKTQEEKYEILMEEAEIAVLDYLEKQADAVNETNATALLDEASIASGKVIFEKNCVTCHGPQGQGVAGLGPNFCDPYWIYGGDIKDVFRTIKHGTEKGMAPWKEQLRPMEIHKVASFIMTLQGTNPPNPKEPEGTLYETKNAEIHNDSLATEEIGMLIK